MLSEAGVRLTRWGPQKKQDDSPHAIQVGDLSKKSTATPSESAKN
jgi:hypothetical protein